MKPRATRTGGTGSTHGARSLGRAMLGLGAAALLAGLWACGPKDGDLEGGGAVIQNRGSDTCVNLAQRWSEEYRKVEPGVSVEVGGGGSGVGISDLIKGMVDIANASRPMRESERAMAKANNGVEPEEFIVGYDAMAIYVHKDNPIEELTIAQLAEIYGRGGTIDTWSQLGIDNTAGCPSDEIARVSRQNTSGTYMYFMEHVLDKNDFKPGSNNLSGSKDVVEQVGHTPCAIGYSGMGYKTDEVKFVKIAAAEGEPAYEPTLENVLEDKYPLARPLYMYTQREPTGHVKRYLEWVLSPDGQNWVEVCGYVPVPAVEDQ